MYCTVQGKKNRDFVQSFFLAVQDKGYFVLNDTFRYLSGRSAAPQTPTPKEAGFHGQPYDKQPYQVFLPPPPPPLNLVFLSVEVKARFIK